MKRVLEKRRLVEIFKFDQTFY